MLTNIYYHFNSTLSQIGNIFFWFNLHVRLYTNKFTKNNCSTITEKQKNRQTTLFVRHAAPAQPASYLRPLSVHQQNAVGMAFRLRADSDQIGLLNASWGDGIEPTIFGMIKQSQALNIVTLH